MSRFGGRAGAPGADPSPGEPEPRRSRLRDSVAAATERIQEIIDTAEQVAEGIHRDAEAEAERYLSERRREADRLAGEHVDRLEGALATARDRLARIEAEGTQLVAELQRAIEAVRPPETGEPAFEVVERPPGATEPAAQVGSEGEVLRERALIRATQMAVSGSARAEIETALREEIGVSDPAPIVDQVLGG